MKPNTLGQLIARLYDDYYALYGSSEAAYTVVEARLNDHLLRKLRRANGGNMGIAAHTIH